MIARSITLDTSRAGSQLSMTVRKGETSIYSLAVSFCEKGTPIYVPDTYTAILRGYKADGTAVSRNATITGGRVTTGFPEQSFTAVGVAQFEIDCYGPGGEVLFSPEFDVLVEDTVSEGAVQSSNDFTALQQALMRANRGFVIQGVPYASIGALKAAITEPNMGDMYEVVDGFEYDIYRWTGDTSVGDDGWLNHGHMSGKSAYDVAVDGGYAGTQAEWLASLVGASGTPGEAGGTGEPGAAGTSAYLHIRWGTSATPSTLLEIPDEYIGVASTSNAIAPATYDGYVWYKYKGEDGSPGAPGEPGAPGDPGTPGASAYVHIRWGTSETPATLLTSPNDYIGIASTSSATAPDDYTGYNWYQYKGADGDPGSPGVGVPSGGTSTQVLVKTSATDYATAWGNAILQYSTMPTAAAGLAGQIVQFTGATGTYTNGYTYICQSDGGAGYEWAEHATGDYSASAQGIPAGGTAGQALVKSSATDYATEWAAVGRTNHGLLHNGDWKTPINQRSATGAVSNAYCIDRWIGNGTVTPVAGSYVTLANGTTMIQLIEVLPTKLLSKVVTASIEIGGAMQSATLTFPSYESGPEVSSALTGVTVEIGFVDLGSGNTSTLEGVASRYIPYFKITATSAINVQRVKLEIGTVSTHANDAPADYGEQLMICRRYYRPILVLGVATNTIYLSIASSFTPVMRVAPTIPEIGTTIAYAPYGAPTINAILSGVITANDTILYLNSDAAPFVVGTAYGVTLTLVADF